MLKKANNIVGAGLRPNVGISTAYAKAIVNELELMYRDIQRQLDKIAKSETYGQAMDASLAATLIYTTQSRWSDYEKGKNRIHPAIWELFLIKRGQLNE